MLLDIITENIVIRNRVYKIKPVHDWSSHAADAMRTLAVGLKNINLHKQRQTKVDTNYKVL